MPIDICESKYTLSCVHGTKPPCSCACPLNLNLRDFMSKAKRNFDSAYRVLATDLVFPEIAVRLCGGQCASACAENIDIPALEQSCLKYAARKTPPRFSIAPKEKRVAVIGAGLAGLACTHRLAARGYPVTVFDRREEIGGSLFSVLDRELCMQEFKLQFTYAPYEFRGGVSIDSLEELSGYDAVFIATGKDGDDFGLLSGWDSKPMATAQKGVWLGGEVTGASRIEALAQGRVAGISIEKYLLMSESMAGVETSFIQTECLFEAKNSGAEPVPHENGFDKVSAKAEAARCRQCDCTLCYDSCSFMQTIRMFPADIEAITRTIPVRDGALGQREGSRMSFSCAVCGHCGSVCPHGISLEEVFMGAKSTLHSLGAFPPQIHNYYISDMLQANGEDYLLKLPEGQEKAEYLFFPGCQAAQSGAEHVKSAYGYLNEHCGATGIWLGCCGISALWAGDEELFEAQKAKLKSDWEQVGKPTVVMLCPTCIKTFRAHLPEISCVSLYGLMAERGLPESARYSENEAAVFDPCASRDFPEMQQAVRKLSSALGARLSELRHSGETALCCGNGGHIYTANKKVSDKISGDAAALSDLPYITYCENCRNSFLIQGKECRHILDDLFGLEPLKSVPHIDRLKKSRSALRHSFCGSAPAGHDDMEIVISDGVYQKMDRLLISAEDMKAVICHGEESRSRIRLEGEGHYIGHLQCGYITFWAEYRKLGEGRFELLNAYSHKMNLLEG